MTEKTFGTSRFPPGAAFVNGEYCPISEARISVLDYGLLHSDATYDVVHVWERRFFRLDLHIERFFQSAEALRLKIPISRDELGEILSECVKRSGLDNAYVEMACTRGLSPTFSRDPRDAVNTFFAFAIPFGWIANEEQRQRGLHLHVSATRRIPPESVDPTVKNYHWLDFINGLFEAYEQHAETVVLVNAEGGICEGPGFNLFVIKDGNVITPEKGVLLGITRRTVLELCEQHKIPVEQRAIPAIDLPTADEIFITSTAGGLMPVTKADGKKVADGRVGPITKKLTKFYWDLHKHPDWTTPVS